MKSQHLNVAAFLQRSRVNGPGTRAVIWLQGCAQEPPCSGCYNPSMHDPATLVERLAPLDLANEILGLVEVDGVTLTGGEPFLQSSALATLARTLRENGLTVVSFTGYTIEQLGELPGEGHRALLSNTDLLVDGPYVQALKCQHPLFGSANQQLHYLSGRITPADLAGLAPAQAELCIDQRGNVVVSGLPDEQLLALLQASSRTPMKEIS